MSIQLTITAPSYNGSTMGTTVTRSLSQFSATPSNTYLDGYTITNADLSVYLESYAILTSGDAYIRMNGTQLHEGRLLPRHGNTYSYSVLSYINSRGDFNNVSVRFESEILTYTVEMSNLRITYVGVPYKFTKNVQGSGTISTSHSSSSRTAINLTATPITGYKFVKWSDGATANPYNYDPGEITSTTITAIFEPIKYDMVFHDLVNNNTITKNCSYGQSYYYPAVPTIPSEIPVGKLAPKGWTTFYNDNTYSYGVRYKDQLIYNLDKTSYTYYTSNNTFSNLTTSDGSVFHYYFDLFPIIYDINYIHYRQGKKDNPSTSIEYRFYGKENHTLKTLPTPSNGYKLTNQMEDINSSPNLSITNEWFINSENVSVGDSTISFIDQYFLGDSYVYAYETPIQYLIKFYDCVKEEKEIYSMYCDYNTSYIFPDIINYDISEIPYGETLSPGWTSWYNDKTFSYGVRYDNKELYNSNNVKQTYYKSGTTFSNLSSTEGNLIKLYLDSFPTQYTVEYVEYKKNNKDAPTITKDYRFFNKEDYILKNLPSATSGYKLTNQMTENNGTADLSIVNEWFIDSNNINPNDTKITLIEKDFLGNCTVYSYETENQYIVKFYDYINQKNDEPLILVCNYSQSYNYPSIPAINALPEGKGAPLGWSKFYDDGTYSYCIRVNTNVLYTSNNALVSMYTPENTFSKLASVDGEVVSFYFDSFPTQYLVKYTQYVKGSMTNYSTSTQYRICGAGDFSLKTLPDATKNYKLTNKMIENNGPIQENITNSWFVSSELMSPTDEKITTIDSNYLGNYNLYSYEAPINFKIIYNICDANNNILKTYNSPIYYYLENFNLNDIPENKENYILQGWYFGDQDIADWYYDSKAFLFNGETPQTHFIYGNSFPFSKIDILDQQELNFYSYYIPYSYFIEYFWGDQWGDTVDLPEKQMRIFGKEGSYIAAIPTSEEYKVLNAGTIKWQYENSEGVTVENDKSYIDDNKNYSFYAFKEPYKRHITFAVNNDNWGTLTIENPQPNDLYDEGYEIKVKVEPTNIAYLSHWQDGVNQHERTFVVGAEHEHYVAYFRSNQIYIGMLGILEAYKKNQLVKTFNLPKELGGVKGSSYTVNKRGTYGFFLNDKGYYESNNQKIANSAAVSRIIFSIVEPCYLYLDCINSGESSYDFGLISKINQSLTTSNTVDSPVMKNFSGQHSTTNIVPINFGLVDAGTFFIDVKYKKDGSVDKNNDSLQFKVRFEPIMEG